MLNKLDNNRRVGEWLSQLSLYLAARRGLPMLVGAALTLISTILTPIIMVIIVVSTDSPMIWLLLCLPALLLHLGVFIALIGIMMAAPLGASYGES